MKPIVASFFDYPSATFSHVVHSGMGSQCAIIDSVLGYEPHAGRTNTESADQILDYVAAQGLRVEWILETHIHADHLSAATYLKDNTGGRIGASRQVEQVCNTFRELYNLAETTSELMRHFDHLFDVDEAFNIGPLLCHALYVPGHTPADVAYLVENKAVFVGDTLFAPDVGTARCDFPGGSAPQLYQSIRRLLSLPPETRLYMCHDYPSTDRELIDYCTVLDQLRNNIHVKEGITQEDFISMRTGRDATLEIPRLLIPSIQVNVRAGDLPTPETNGTRYLKVPLDMF
ncbi:MAG: MBL fold metallo-hydrolase [Oceanospirillales bacterium]|nr:MBL fold metallo-hydrolase [Oceanospirillales bacterium]